MKDTFRELRKRGKLPLWLSDSTWKSRQEYWASEKFKNVSAQAKKNWNSDQDGLGPSLYTCGSIPFNEQKRRLVSTKNSHLFQFIAFWTLYVFYFAIYEEVSHISTYLHIV